MKKERLCLISGKEIKDETCFYFIAPELGRKFFVSCYELQKSGNMTCGELYNLALLHPERGMPYEKVGKERLEKILQQCARKYLQRAARHAGCYAS